MPLPKPRKDEKKDEFIGRCMSALQNEFSHQKQRSAVCYDIYKKELKASWKDMIEELETE